MTPEIRDLRNEALREAAKAQPDRADAYRRVAVICERSTEQRTGRAFGAMTRSQTVEVVMKNLVNEQGNVDTLPARAVLSWAQTRLAMLYYLANPFRGAEWKPMT